MSVGVSTREFVARLTAFEYREVVMTLAVAGVALPALVLFPGFGELTAGIQANVTTTDLLLFALLTTVAAVVKGTVGFGYALIATPVAATVVDPQVAVVVLAVPPLMINVFQVGETNTGLGYVRRNWSLIGAALVGSAVGVFVLRNFQNGPLIPFLIGLVIFGYAVYQVATQFVVVEAASHPVALGVVGVLEGFFLGAANLGPLLPAYLHTFERDTERYVGGLSMVLAFVFAQRIVQMLLNGLMTPYLLWLGSAIAVVTLVGLAAGSALRRAGLDGERFDWVVVGLLTVIALNIFRKTLPALLG